MLSSGGLWMEPTLLSGSSQIKRQKHSCTNSPGIKEALCAYRGGGGTQVRRGSRSALGEDNQRLNSDEWGGHVSQLLLRNKPSHMPDLKQIFIPHDLWIGDLGVLLVSLGLAHGVAYQTTAGGPRQLYPCV